jgi:hypothetical protein
VLSGTAPPLTAVTAGGAAAVVADDEELEVPIEEPVPEEVITPFADAPVVSAELASAERT